MKARATKKVKVKVIPDASASALQGFVTDNIRDSIKVYTDQSRSYRGLRNHESVYHGFGHYVKSEVYVNGLESFWALSSVGIRACTIICRQSICTVMRIGLRLATTFSIWT